MQRCNCWVLKLTRAYASCRRYLTTDQQGPAKEAKAVKSLLSLGQQLAAKSSKEASAPLRVRGSGFWSDRAGGKVRSSPLEQDENPASTSKAPESRSMKDSYVSYDLLFESDQELREIYVGGMASIRIGRLMEDLDTLAGSVAYKHVLPAGMTRADTHKAGLYLVTAAVDRLDMLRPLSATDPEDLRLSGFISYTGRSSLEVFVKLESISRAKGLAENPEPILLGRFTMACRDAKTQKARPIPQLIPETPEEESMTRLGQQFKAQKKEQASKSLDLRPPNPEETARLHSIFVGHADWFNGTTKPEHVVWTKDTELYASQLMHPQERNVHSKVFGGYLMRLSYENAFSAASLFARNRVTFLSLDELSFRKPVEIGSLLNLKTKVAYSPTDLGKHRSFQVSVEAATINLQTGERQITNIFHYTFQSDHPLDRYILPQTYFEGIEWLEAMRRREIGQELRSLYVE